MTRTNAEERAARPRGREKHRGEGLRAAGDRGMLGRMVRAGVGALAAALLGCGGADGDGVGVGVGLVSAATSTSDPGTTSGAVAETTSDAGSSSTTEAATTTTTEGVTTSEDSGGTTEPGCVPEVCNDVDDDCDGEVDEVDAGGDGVNDCVAIALFGDDGDAAPSDFLGWLQARGADAERTQTDGAPLTAEALAAYDVIVLDRLVRAYTDDEALLLRDWVTAGGGLMALTGHGNYAEDSTRPNSIIKHIGLQYAGDYVDGKISTWTPHPIGAGVDELPVYGGLVVVVDGNVDGGANKIVGMMGGLDVGVYVQERGAGRVVVFADEWISRDAEWQGEADVPVFWVNTLAWLAGP